MKIIVPVLDDATLYTCDGQVAIAEGDVIDDNTLVPCIHGHGMKIGQLEFDTREEFEEWLTEGGE